MSGALAGLPPAQRALTPELTPSILADEPGAACSACPLVAGAGRDGPFHPNARCCTYHPTLPNHAVGRALGRGGEGARLVRARIAAGGGVYPWGVSPTAAWSATYADKVRRGGFGRTLALRCPYWRGGALACGIWQDRDAVCRTWHCHHAAGPRGLALWQAARDALRAAERGLAHALVARGRPPAAGSPVKRWVGWYRWCARAVDKLTVDDLAEDDRVALADARVRVAEALLAARAPVPEVLVPSVAGVNPTDDGVRLTGYLSWVTRDLPRDVFALLSRLDGETSWPDALAAAEADLGRPLAEGIVDDLYRAGLVEAHDPDQRYAPGMTLTVQRGDEQTRIVHDDP